MISRAVAVRKEIFSYRTVSGLEHFTGSVSTAITESDCTDANQNRADQPSIWSRPRSNIHNMKHMWSRAPTTTELSALLFYDQVFEKNQEWELDAPQSSIKDNVGSKQSAQKLGHILEHVYEWWKRCITPDKLCRGSSEVSAIWSRWQESSTMPPRRKHRPETRGWKTLVGHKFERWKTPEQPRFPPRATS